MEDKKESPNDFAQQAAESSPSFISELWGYMKQNKKWWLTPILLVLILMGVLLVLAASGAAPFIYTLF